MGTDCTKCLKKWHNCRKGTAMQNDTHKTGLCGSVARSFGPFPPARKSAGTCVWEHVGTLSRASLSCFSKLRGVAWPGSQERPNLGCFETILFGCRCLNLGFKPRTDVLSKAGKKAAAWSSTLALINSLQLWRAQDVSGSGQLHKSLELDFFFSGRSSYGRTGMNSEYSCVSVYSF